jgi:hypothetical protein
LELSEWESLFAECGLETLSVHADQWPRQRLRRLLPGERRRSPRENEPVATPLLPMRFANEFIFVLRKRGARET